MAYTIILVDDEDEVRGRIAAKFAGSEDFEVIGSASNGYDALDLLEDNIPDVVITDIKMPFVDGIELTREIRKSYPTVKVAIISGYDDYSYLKEAINLDVVAYLSKPITKGNVGDFLEKIKETLDAENEHIRHKENMVLNQIRNRIIYHHLSDINISVNDDRMFEELGINPEGNYTLVSHRILNFPSGIIMAEKKKNQCYLMIEELVNEAFKGYHLLYGQDIISVIEVKGDDFEKELDILLYKIVNYLEKYVSVDNGCGVSGTGKFENLMELYRQSQLALEESEVDEHGAISYFKDIEEVHEVKTLSVEELNEFRKNMKFMSKKDFAAYANKFAKRIHKDSAYDCFGVIIAISGLFVEYSDSIGAGNKRVVDINHIKAYVDDRNIEGFFELIVDLVGEMKLEVISRKTKKSNKIMNDIISYIEKNYDNSEMNMDMVCDTFHISVSYLSALFKKETETTFSKYLVSRRIDQAKMLIRETDDKIVTIAEKCGYKDVYYFSHSFKKTAGVSPKEFRKNEISR